MPHIGYAIISGIMAAIIVVLAIALALAEPERNPASRRVLAASGAACEVRAVVIKLLIVIVGATLNPFHKVQSVVLAGLTLHLAWIYFIQVRC